MLDFQPSTIFVSSFFSISNLPVIIDNWLRTNEPVSKIDWSELFNFPFPTTFVSSFFAISNFWVIIDNWLRTDEPVSKVHITF